MQKECFRGDGARRLPNQDGSVTDKVSDREVGCVHNRVSCESVKQNHPRRQYVRR